MNQPGVAPTVVQPSASTRAAESLNRQTWQREDVLAEYASLEGWSDPGEWRAIQLLAPELRNKRILDIGVGSGRTTTWLRLLTDDYVGIDYTQGMVEQAAARHPDADIRHGDARDLSEFADASFDALNFSFSGIDAVGHDDRARVLSEMARVLKPGGVALYSTFNRSGPDFARTPLKKGELPWQVGSLQGSWTPRPVRLAKTLLRTARDPGRPLREYKTWKALHEQGEAHATWGMAPLGAHGYGLLIHWVTPVGARAEAAAVGLDVELLIAAEGPTLYEATTGLTGDVSSARWFHVIARRRAEPATD
ncbi:MAG TPA: class I SAM-dependent methyltransferase [Mycobacteriales bacterium]|nr:class I SAM-dependent methyltransferase [Mycobacteriales bacterium]